MVWVGVGWRVVWWCSMVWYGGGVVLCCVWRGVLYSVVWCGGVVVWCDGVMVWYGVVWCDVERSVCVDVNRDPYLWMQAKFMTD